MNFRVEISARAKRDLDRILDWLIKQRASRAGLRWFEGLEGAVASLAISPRSCPLALERHLSFETRQLLYGKRPHVYRVLFTLHEDLVTVLHIRHGRRARLHRL